MGFKPKNKRWGTPWKLLTEGISVKLSWGGGGGGKGKKGGTRGRKEAGPEAGRLALIQFRRWIFISYFSIVCVWWHVNSADDAG